MTALPLNGKQVDLSRLSAELIAAGVAHNALGTSGDGADVVLFTYDEDGAPIALPAGAAAVVAAHVPPVEKSALLEVKVEDVRTTTATQATLVAWPLAVQTLYTARFTLTAIDVGNADCRVWHATATAKRLNNGALMVGAGTIVSSHADAGAASWGVAADTSGNTFRVRVTGASGRTISWSLLGEVVRARPDGLVD